METKILLKESEMPREWYNIVPDLPSPLPPPLHPGTKQPIGPDDLKAIFPMGLIEQEMSSERWIKIPEEILKIYTLWRPSPVYRALRLEEVLKSPAKIYYKYEGVSPAGSHKPNTAVAQAYYNKKEGVKRIATETGAGQWGSALCFATNLFGMECTVYMVKVSYEQKPYRRSMMETWGGKVIPSPSSLTESGKKILAADPNCPGSLGIAISEAVEDAATHKEVNYSLGSVLNHVCLHQTIVGLEAKKQMQMVGDYPDVVIGCVGGGSNFAGLAIPFIQDKLTGKKVRALAVEPVVCPSLTRGLYAYDFGDAVGLTPLLKMYTLGHSFVPPRIHAGGLRYHGVSPLICHLLKQGLIEARAYTQRPVFEAAVTFARCEGIIMAPESAHACKAVFDEVERCKQEGKKETILFNLSGHGLVDMAAYDDYFSGKMQDVALSESELNRAMADLPKV
ncbi:MAG: TrpB-like pyridoxal phosphate-dependent enzyme [Proteobacteria bacterium]|nr:TrpB-like pyridoxal phosphate-dependent enzyme [Pseudomonadota bacterium]